MQFAPDARARRSIFSRAVRAAATNVAYERRRSVKIVKNVADNEITRGFAVEWPRSLHGRRHEARLVRSVPFPPGDRNRYGLGGPNISKIAKAICGCTLLASFPKPDGARPMLSTSDLRIRPFLSPAPLFCATRDHGNYGRLRRSVRLSLSFRFPFPFFFAEEPVLF